MVKNASTANPRFLRLPSGNADAWRRFLEIYCQGQLFNCRELLQEVKSGTAQGGKALLQRLNEALVALGNAASCAALFAQVHPDETLRQYARSTHASVSELSIAVAMDREIYGKLLTVDRDALDEESLRFVRLTLKGFERAGVALPHDSRARLEELKKREAELCREFSANISNDVRYLLIDKTALSGLPQDWLGAHPPDDNGMVKVGIDGTNVRPIMNFCRDAEVRHRFFLEFQSRAYPANDDVLQQLLALRAERAQLLGHQDWASYAAEPNMAGSAKAVEEFIEAMAVMVKDSALRDKAALLKELRKENPSRNDISVADLPYYAEKTRSKVFCADEKVIRSFFHLNAVISGLLDVTSQVFGLSYVAAKGNPTWHPDVRVFDVEQSGELIGRVYLDLHPRSGKPMHISHSALMAGVEDRQLPEGVLIASLNGGPQHHADVVSLFHEFGHLLHHVLGGGQKWVSFSGAKVERDFAEVPAQVLEELAWNFDILRHFALNEQDEPISAELVHAMSRARMFGMGYMVRISLSYAAISYWFHRIPALERADLTSLARALQERFDVFEQVDETYTYASFLHLKSYSSNAYSYLWSQVIARDILCFVTEADGTLNISKLQEFRDIILCKGGSRSARELVEDFIGRPFSMHSFSRWVRNQD